MPKRMNESDIDSMFDDIGRAKENMAKGIVEQQRKEAEEARRHRPFGGGGEIFDDDVDLDAMEREVEEELRLARQGVPVQQEPEAANEPEPEKAEDAETPEPKAEETPAEDAKPKEEVLVESDFVLNISKEPGSKEEPETPEVKNCEDDYVDDDEDVPLIPDINLPITLPAPAVILPSEVVNTPHNAAEDETEVPASAFVLDLSERYTSHAQGELSGKQEPAPDPVPEVSEAEKEPEQETPVVEDQPAESTTEPVKEPVVAETPAEETPAEGISVKELVETPAEEFVKPSAEESEKETKSPIEKILPPDIAKCGLHIKKTESGFEYMFSVETSNGKKFAQAESLDVVDREEALFMAAVAFLDRVASLKDQTIVLTTEKDNAYVLRRNAAFGIVGKYSDACTDYIKKVRAIASDKSLRLDVGEKPGEEVWKIF